ncbi:SOS response-associated peptidase family protein, partial [Alcanivorax sp. HI0007]
NAFAESRCLVPCSGWYEWRDEGGPRKEKYHFAAADGNPLLMGGILFPGEEGPKLVTLTITPNQACAEYHHRMPQFVPHQHL